MNAEEEVLEIGVGGGRVAKLAAPRVKTLTVTDLSEEMLKKAKETLKD